MLETIRRWFGSEAAPEHVIDELFIKFIDGASERFVIIEGEYYIGSQILSFDDVYGATHHFNLDHIIGFRVASSLNVPPPSYSTR